MKKQWAGWCGLLCVLTVSAAVSSTSSAEDEDITTPAPASIPGGTLSFQTDLFTGQLTYAIPIQRDSRKGVPRQWRLQGTATDNLLDELKEVPMKQ